MKVISGLIAKSAFKLLIISIKLNNMKYVNRLLTIIVLVVSVSCVNEYDFEMKEYAKTDELETAEYINKYDVLKSYIDSSDAPSFFKLGAIGSIASYLDKEAVFSLMYTNFNQVAPIDELKYNTIVQDDGVYDFSGIEKFLTSAQDDGMPIFGRTLVENSNQNATFLNTTLEPTIIPGEGSGPAWDVLTDISFENDEASGYSSGGSAVESFTANGGGASGEGRALVINNPAVQENDWGTQLFITFDKTTEVGQQFRLTMDVKADVDASVPTQAHTSPGAYKHWNFFGSVDFTTEWTTFTSEITIYKTDQGDISGVTTIALNLGNIATNYYFDNIKVEWYNEESTSGGNPDEVLIEAENGSAGQYWSTEENEFASGEKYIVATNPETVGDPAAATSDYIATYNFSVNTAGTYTLWSRTLPTVNNGADDSYYISVNGSAFNFNWGWNFGSTEWLWTNLGTYPLTSGENTLKICTREDGFKVDKFYFTLTDNVPTGLGQASGSDVIIEMTEEEKKDTLTYEMERWISEVMNVTKDYITAWDVVNEPMDDNNPYELKTSAGEEADAADEFFWQDYLGKDYGVTAFMLARRYCKPGSSILFINESNLESNIDKCKGLIEYVKYIEDQGQTVDGVGTQMHISTTSDKEKIVEMFTLLAETGKLIKISELDIAIGDGVKTAAVTNEQLDAQKEMYKYVVETYLKIIPVSQQYGITLWSPLDSPDGSSWRAGEPIGLWTHGYNRKPAYAGFADGLLGK